jgi:hypothetical protein
MDTCWSKSSFLACFNILKATLDKGASFPLRFC